MDTGQRIERALERAVGACDAAEAPPLLRAAIRHAVFPGGARVRPRLTLAVAAAIGETSARLADGAAAAIELIHCASLVHDDLPCFDNAPTRRGRPSVQAAFGAPLALLAGDALIVMAFETLGRAAARQPSRLGPLLAILAAGAGAPRGIVAGQAWESEPHPDGEVYRKAKTGALFVAATMSGALAGGADPAPWRALGEHLGAAYQVADDLLDVAATEADKPLGQDAALGRPNAVSDLGIAGACARLERLIADALAAIPPCRGAEALRELVRLQAVRLAPKRLLQKSAA